MVELIALTDVEDNTIEVFQNRKVCDVIEYDRMNLCGRYKGWMGSTETEYFSVVFMAGFLTISVEERECNLGYDIRRYACVTPIYKALIEKDDNAMRNIVLEYTEEQLKHDNNNITFQDVMSVLKWSFVSDKVKVTKDMMYH